MGRLFTTAMSGRSKERPELAEKAISLVAHLPVIAARGGEELVKRLFEPLGYQVTVEGSRLDEAFPKWGGSPYVSVTISGMVRLQDLLTHLYVLIRAHACAGSALAQQHRQHRHRLRFWRASHGASLSGA